MTGKEQVWLAEYLKCLNATEAARRAGYKWPEKVSHQLKQKHKEAIAQELDKKLLDAQSTLARVSDIATADVTDYMLDDGRMDIKRMKADGRGYLLKKYKHTKASGERKDGAWSSETTDVELYPADGALDKLMRYHSLYKDKQELSGEVQVIIKYADDNP